MTSTTDYGERTRKAIDEIMARKDGAMADSQTTKLLCKLLEERGVEYFTDDNERAHDEPARTTWDFVLCGYEMTVTATELVDIEGKTYLEMDFHHAFTPEQAIAATLGNGTLTAEQVRKAIESRFDFDVWVPPARWQAIADELNAELGSENAELRELVKGYRSFATMMYDCWLEECKAGECVDASAVNAYLYELGQLDECMAELGIEVEP